MALRASLRRFGPAGLLAGSLLLAGPAQADYRIQRGDVLDVAVFGAADLTRRAPVDVDGQAHLPLLGAVDVAGLSLAEVRTKLNRLLADGQLVKVPDVTVEVAEYRPVFIRGDVLNAGSFPYRPGLTMRQALALSGGSGLRPGSSGGASASAASVADLRGEYAALSTELVWRQARLDRLRAELDKSKQIDFAAFAGRTLAPEVVSRIKTLETRQMDAVRAAAAKDADHLVAMAGFASDQLDTLDAQRKEVEQNIKLQSDEVDKVKGLFLKGIVTSNRMTDEQRALAAARIQLLSNIAQAGDVRRLKADFDDKAREAQDAHDLEVLKDLQLTIVEVEKTRVRLVATGQKLIALKDSGAQPQGDLGGQPRYTIHRGAGGEASVLQATEDTELMPGDVIEVKDGDTVVLSAAAPGPAPAPAPTSSTSPDGD